MSSRYADTSSYANKTHLLIMLIIALSFHWSLCIHYTSYGDRLIWPLLAKQPLLGSSYIKSRQQNCNKISKTLLSTSINKFSPTVTLEITSSKQHAMYSKCKLPKFSYNFTIYHSVLTQLKLYSYHVTIHNVLCTTLLNFLQFTCVLACNKISKTLLSTSINNFGPTEYCTAVFYLYYLSSFSILSNSLCRLDGSNKHLTILSSDWLT